jgi:hypothetical protein
MIKTDSREIMVNALALNIKHYLFLVLFNSEISQLADASLVASL